jgi:hypothetical protein
MFVFVCLLSKMRKSIKICFLLSKKVGSACGLHMHISSFPSLNMNAQPKSMSTKTIAKRAARRAMRAFNAPTYRGFRNKGKVAAGELLRPSLRDRRFRSRAHNPKTVQGSQFSQRTFSAPAAMGSVVKATAVRRRVLVPIDEYIADVVTPAGVSAFANILTGPINPGNDALFPKLATTCDAFEKFRFRKLRIAFTPDSSTATSGALYMNFDYDPDDTAPTNATQVMQNSDAVAFAPWLSASINLDTKQDAAKWYYINNVKSNGALAADRQQDQAVFNLFTDRIAQNVLLGQLQITGLVELIGSRPPQALAMVNSGASTFPTASLTLTVAVNLDTYYNSAVFPIGPPAVARGITRGTRAIGDTNLVAFVDSANKWYSFAVQPGSYVFTGNMSAAFTAAAVMKLYLVAINSSNVVTALSALTGTITGTGGTPIQVALGPVTINVPAGSQLALAVASNSTGVGLTNTNVSTDFISLSPTTQNINLGNTRPSDKGLYVLPDQYPQLLADFSGRQGTLNTQFFDTEDAPGGGPPPPPRPGAGGGGRARRVSFFGLKVGVVKVPLPNIFFRQKVWLFFV